MPQTVAAMTDAPEWVAVLDQISASLAESLAAVHEPEQVSDPADAIGLTFSAGALDEIDARLRGFDDRLAEIRALAASIESTLAEDESAVLAFRRSTAAARARPAPAARL